MAFEKLEAGATELDGEYPKFDEIGDYVEGNFMGLEQGDYGKQIVIWKGNDPETGLAITQTLPSHKSLKKYYNKLTLGDYIKVELVKIIPSTNEKYSDKKIYDVYVDPDRAVEFAQGVEEE